MPRSIMAAALLVLMSAVPALAGETADWQRSLTIEYQLGKDGGYQADQRFDIVAASPEAAHRIAQQSYGWSMGLEQIVLREAYTKKADGRILKVAPDAVLNQPLNAGTAYPSFSDWQMRSIVFPDVQPGDTVHYVLHRVSTQPLFPGMFEAAMRLGPASQLSKADITVQIPPGVPLQVGTDLLQEDQAEHRADGTVVRHWHLDTDKDDGAEAEWTASSFPDYAALGQAYAARALPRAEPDTAVRALAKRLVADTTDRRDQAKALYNYVAGQIRYVGLQMGEGRIVPRPAGEVLASGYGDCKDHVTLLQSLLMAVGIRSVPALISTKPRYDLPMPPTLDVLDHVILYMPELNIWADATSGFAPFGVLPIGEYGKPVVMAAADGARVGIVAQLALDEAWTRVRTDLDIAEDGSLSGRTQTRAGGPYAVALREIADNLGSADMQLQRLGTPGEGDFEFDPPMAPNSNDYSISARFSLEDGVDDASDHRIVPPAGPTVMVRPGGFLVAETAIHGVHVCYAGKQEEEIHLHVPETMTVPVLPPDVDVQGGFARYQAKWDREGADVVVRRQFRVQTTRPVCSQEEYEDMRPVLRAARLDLRTRLALRNSQHTKSAVAMLLRQPMLKDVRATMLLPQLNASGTSQSHD